MSNRAGTRRAVRGLSAGVALPLMAAACGGDGGGGGGKEAGATPLPIDQQVPIIGTLADDFTFGPNDRPSLGKYPLNTSVLDTLNNQRMESVFRVSAR